MEAVKLTLQGSTIYKRQVSELFFIPRYRRMHSRINDKYVRGLGQIQGDASCLQ
jgi:hypothetical protein